MKKKRSLKDDQYYIRVSITNYDGSEIYDNKFMPNDLIVFASEDEDEVIEQFQKIIDYTTSDEF